MSFTVRLGTIFVFLGWGLTLPLDADSSRAKEVAPEKGKVAFKVIGDQKQVPERYRLETHEFPFEMKLKHDLGAQGFEVYELSFPSAVETKHKENNTVYAEYYRPKGEGPFPAVIVLDILQGDMTVARMQAALLVKNQIAALCVYMPYYGPRRPANDGVRMLMPDVEHSLDAVRQTVLDVRRASAWLETRPEVDKRRLGVLGTSLGSFMGALSAAMEPRLGRVVVLLGGGGLVDALYDDPRAEQYRKAWEALGGTKEKLREAIAPADPLTYAANLKDRKLLIIGAKRDDIVPPKATEALWQATGKQKIVWFEASHVGAALFLIPAMQHVLEHFQAP